VDSKDQKHNAQNRLLMAAAVLTFLYYAEARFQGVSAIGATIVFKNEDAVQEFAWVIWFYYFVRTYQYYKESGVEAFRRVINEGYVENIGHLLLGIEEHEFKLLPADDPIKSSVIRIGIGPIEQPWAGWRTERLSTFPVARRISRLIMRFRRSGQGQFDGLLGVPTINFFRGFSAKGALTRWVLRCLNPFRTGAIGVRAVVYPPTNRFEQQGQHKLTVPLPVWSLWRVLSVYHRTIVFRPQFTENQVPLIVGLVPVWYLIFRNRDAMAGTFAQLGRWLGVSW